MRKASQRAHATWRNIETMRKQLEALNANSQKLELETSELELRATRLELDATAQEDACAALKSSIDAWQARSAQYEHVLALCERAAQELGAD